MINKSTSYLQNLLVVIPMALLASRIPLGEWQEAVWLQRKIAFPLFEATGAAFCALIGVEAARHLQQWAQARVVVTVAALVGAALVSRSGLLSIPTTVVLLVPTVAGVLWAQLKPAAESQTPSSSLWWRHALMWMVLWRVFPSWSPATGLTDASQLMAQSSGKALAAGVVLISALLVVALWRRLQEKSAKWLYVVGGVLMVPVVWMAIQVRPVWFLVIDVKQRHFSPSEGQLIGWGVFALVAWVLTAREGISRNNMRSRLEKQGMTIGDVSVKSTLRDMMTTSWALPTYLGAAAVSVGMLFLRAWTQQKTPPAAFVGIFIVIGLVAAAELGLWRHLEQLRNRVRALGPDHEVLVGDANIFVAFVVTPLWLWRRFSLSNALSTAMMQKPSALLWTAAFAVLPALFGVLAGAGSFSERQAAPLMMGLSVVLFAFLTAKQLWRLHVGLALLESRNR